MDGLIGGVAAVSLVAIVTGPLSVSRAEVGARWGAEGAPGGLGEVNGMRIHSCSWCMVCSVACNRGIGGGGCGGGGGAVSWMCG